jgi:hypothetical protein
MASFFRRILGWTKPAPPPFNLEREVAELLATLPPCGARVVVASPRYSGNYRCEVTVTALTLAPFVAKLSRSTFGGTRQSQIGRAVFPRWLSDAPREGSNTSYLPPLFVQQIASYVGNLVEDGSANVYCPDCRRFVDDVEMQSRNREVRGPWSEWTEGWRCPEGHILYTKDQEVHILRSRGT